MGLLDNPVTDVIKGLFGIVKDPLIEWQKRKTIKTNGKMEVEKINAQAGIAKANAKLELIKSGQTIESDWDSKAQDDAKHSWKDEFLIVVFFSPVVALFATAFIDPKYQQRVIDSVKALAEFPLWYRAVLLGIVAASFGLRWLISPLINKITFKPKKKTLEG